MPATNQYRTANEKLPIIINGYKGAIEYSNPQPFRGFVYLPELNMTAQTYGKSVDEVKSNLVSKIDELKDIVPARNQAFEQIDRLIQTRFDSKFNAYRYLNSLQPEWRSAPLSRLLEIILHLECLDSAD